jgi:hypothetical protein
MQRNKEPRISGKSHIKMVGCSGRCKSRVICNSKVFLLKVAGSYEALKIICLIAVYNEITTRGD